MLKKVLNMYKRLSFVLPLCFILLSNVSQSQIIFSIFTGLSTPSEYVNDVYNTTLLTKQDVTGQLYRDATRLGYNFGARLGINLEGNLFFYGSASLHRFPETDVNIYKPNTDTLLLRLSTVQNVVPIEAGCTFYLTRSTLGLYILGGLTYNYLTNTTEIKIKNDKFSFPIDSDPVNNRVGFSGGAGLDIDFGLIAAGLEVRYNLINFIGREVNEQNKSYITVNLVATIGGRSKSK